MWVDGGVWEGGSLARRREEPRAQSHPCGNGPTIHAHAYIPLFPHSTSIVLRLATPSSCPLFSHLTLTSVSVSSPLLSPQAWDGAELEIAGGPRKIGDLYVDKKERRREKKSRRVEEKRHEGRRTRDEGEEGGGMRPNGKERRLREETEGETILSTNALEMHEKGVTE